MANNRFSKQVCVRLRLKPQANPAAKAEYLSALDGTTEVDALTLLAIGVSLQSSF